MRTQSQPVVHRYAPIPAIEALAQSGSSQNGVIGSALQWPWRKLTGGTGGKKWLVIIISMTLLGVLLLNVNTGQLVCVSSYAYRSLNIAATRR